MGNCGTKNSKCYFCKTIPTTNIYIVTISHQGPLNNKQVCSLCLEQKIIEKQQLPNCTDILPLPYKKYT